MKQPKNSMRNKTIHYILVYFICLLLAVCIWLAVTYDIKKNEAGENKTVESAEIAAETSCSI